MRYLLAPAYVLLGWLLYPSMWRAQGALIALGLLACAALVLVPSPLIEPRYLTLPVRGPDLHPLLRSSRRSRPLAAPQVLLLRLHAPPLAGARAWLPPAAAFCALNALTIAVFLLRPYVWGDGSTARFMW